MSILVALHFAAQLPCIARVLAARLLTLPCLLSHAASAIGEIAELMKRSVAISEEQLKLQKVDLKRRYMYTPSNATRYRDPDFKDRLIKVQWVLGGVLDADIQL